MVVALSKWQQEHDQEMKFSAWLGKHLTEKYWQPLSLWKIRYIPEDLKSVVEWHDESEKEFKIDNFVFTIWVLNREPKEDGTFDKIKFFPYTIVPFVICGQILDKELIEFNTIEDVNKHGIAVTQSHWIKSGPCNTAYYRIMSSIEHVEPAEEEIEALRREWFLQNS